MECRKPIVWCQSWSQADATRLAYFVLACGRPLSRVRQTCFNQQPVPVQACYSNCSLKLYFDARAAGPVDFPVMTELPCSGCSTVSEAVRERPCGAALLLCSSGLCVVVLYSERALCSPYLGSSLTP